MIYAAFILAVIAGGLSGYVYYRVEHQEEMLNYIKMAIEQSRIKELNPSKNIDDVITVKEKPYIVKSINIDRNNNELYYTCLGSSGTVKIYESEII